MIYRHMLLGYYKEKNTEVSNKAYFSAVKYCDDKVFIYIETKTQDDVKALVSGDFYEFPNHDRLVEMSMIFAYSPSDNDASWERAQKKSPSFEIAYLKHECVAKYVFYHYKMQGEGCASYDRYGSIFLYGNILIMYLEEPRESGESWERILPENNLPGYNGDIISDCTLSEIKGWRKI